MILLSKVYVYLVYNKDYDICTCAVYHVQLIVNDNPIIMFEPVL